LDELFHSGVDDDGDIEIRLLFTRIVKNGLQVEAASLSERKKLHFLLIQKLFLRR
jgi:hypothetical protein